MMNIWNDTQRWNTSEESSRFEPLLYFLTTRVPLNHIRCGVATETKNTFTKMSEVVGIHFMWIDISQLVILVPCSTLFLSSVASSFMADIDLELFNFEKWDSSSFYAMHCNILFLGVDIAGLSGLDVFNLLFVVYSFFSIKWKKFL